MANDEHISSYLDVLPGDLSGVDQFEQATTSSFRKAQVEGEAFFQQTTSLSKELAKIAKANAPTNLAKEYARIAAATGNSKTALIELQTELRKIDASDADIKKAAQVFDTEYTRAIEKAEAATARLTEQQEKAAAASARAAEKSTDAVGGVNFIEQNKQSTFNRENVGDLSTSFSSIASLQGAFGGFGEEATRLASDVTGALEYLPNFREAIKNAGVAASQSTGAIGSASSAFLSLVPTLAPAAAGIAGIVAVAAPVVLVAAAGAAAISLFNTRLEETKKRGEEAAQSLVKQTDAQAAALSAFNKGNAGGLQDAYDSALDTLDSASAKAALYREKLDKLKADYDAQQASGGGVNRELASEINKYTEAVNAADQEVKDAIDVYKGVGEVYNTVAAQQLIASEKTKQAGQVWAASVGNVATQLANGLTTEALNQQIDQTTATIIGLKTQMAALDGVVEESDPAYQQLQSDLQQSNAQLQALSAQTTRTAAATNTATEAQRKMAEVLADFAAETQKLDFAENLQDLRSSRDEARNSARAEITLNQQLAREREQHFDKIEDIEQSGLDKVAELRQQLAEGTDKAYKEIASVTTEAQDKATEATSQYRKEQIRAEQDFEREKAKIARDAREAEFNSILDNDITALIKNRREGQQQLGDVTDKFTIDQQRKAEDFTATQAADQKATADKIASIQTELTAYQAGVQAKILADQMATQKKIADENAAFTEKQTQDQTLRDQQKMWDEENKRTKEQDRAEDAALADAARQQQLAKELEKIGTVEARQEAANAKALAGFNALELAALRIKGAAESIAVPAIAGIGSAIKSGGFSPVSFAKGTYGVDQPTPAIIGDAGPGMAEAVIPYNKNQGLFSALQNMGGTGGGGTVITVPITIAGMQIGSVVSLDEATQIAEAIGDQVYDDALAAVTQGLIDAKLGGKGGSQ